MKLSQTMQEALTLMAASGGKLYRHPGGFWAGNKTPPVQSPYFGTPTISGLRQRGLIEYTEWKDGRGGLFPIEASVISAASTTPLDR